MDLPADMALGGSGPADTINSYPTGTACFADLRDHAVRLMKRGGRHCLAEGARAKTNATAMNLIIVTSICTRLADFNLPLTARYYG